MNPPAPTFNQMVIRYTCTRCGSKCSGQRHAVPSGTLMGRQMMMEYVCVDCLKAHHTAMEHGFWGDMSKPNGGCCHGCTDKLEAGASHAVHRSLKEDGAHELARVCPDCFTEYKTLCIKLAKGNTKK